MTEKVTPYVIPEQCIDCNELSMILEFYPNNTPLNEIPLDVLKHAIPLLGPILDMSVREADAFHIIEKIPLELRRNEKIGAYYQRKCKGSSPKKQI